MSEYISRKRLSGLGFQFNGEKLSASKASVFVLIDSICEELEAEKLKEISRKNK